MMLTRTELLIWSSSWLWQDELLIPGSNSWGSGQWNAELSHELVVVAVAAATAIVAWALVELVDSEWVDVDIEIEVWHFQIQCGNQPNNCNVQLLAASAEYDTTAMLLPVCILDGQQHDLTDISRSCFCVCSIGASAPPALDETVTLPTPCHYWITCKLSLSQGPITTWITHGAMFSSLLLLCSLLSSTSRRFTDSICKHYVLQCTTGNFICFYRYKGMLRHCVMLQPHNRLHVAWLWRVWQLCRRVLKVRGI